MDFAATIKSRASALGFDLVGIASPAAVNDLEFLARWVKDGYGGEMRYLADARREDPRRVLPSVKSVVCVGLNYNAPYPYSTEAAKPAEGAETSTAHNTPLDDAQPRGWISRYAWGKDYHQVMRTKLEQLRTAIEKLAPGVETRVYVDTGPVLERAFARLSGIGWMGKNTCLINEQKGSWFFLGVILTSLGTTLDVPAPDRCGSCTRCLEACPTGALVRPYVMDASRCIAYFNIELKGSIPQEYRKAIGNNVFGCDICQDVCPWNERPLPMAGVSPDAEATEDEPSEPVSTRRSAATTEVPEFQPLHVEVSAGSESAADHAFSLCYPTLQALASITGQDFKRVFARSPIKRAKYRGWLRNLCVAMGNSGDRRFVAWLEASAESPDEMIREHAQWALRELRSES